MLTAPNPPASPAEVHEAERRAGVAFDEQYKDWLGNANGWKFFSGADSLYSTFDLSKDSADRNILLNVFCEYEIQPEELEMESFDGLVVIGGASGDYYIATTGCSGDNCSTAPVWELGGGDYVRYESFKEFMQARIDRMRNAQR
ncbi:SMI1/KNR4 family protein [Nocardia sp. bgisy118]|uniref:SMI1/KNR4 family protein n=1 Tax=Nocardia sp. bgisy118 TaxID=3413786 RepID=UPI003F4A0C0D